MRKRGSEPSSPDAAASAAGRWQEVRRLFGAALTLPVERRAAYLDDACAGDTDLREEVARLLANAELPDGDLSAIVRGAASDAVSPTGTDGAWPDPERIGPYRVERIIGRGGMGAVYLAERDDGRFRQRAAIKIMSRIGDDPQLVTRFRAERQILASLDHPNIARLLDGGETEDGRPYLVMEHVDGESIDVYCTARDVSLERRLELFRKVCLAVQHAHANLVIHRDIKPSNILVTPTGEPKLLDFGIAKLLSPERYGQTVAVTGVAMRLMTPAYASPEQVRGDRITTATDVYALGVLLYELLTGQPPFRLDDVSPAAMVQAICENMPARPSVAVTRSGDREPPSHDALRRTLRGDLDNIVLQAMRKEPEARYRSASELSADVGRYLAGLPVTASRGNWLYHSRKFLVRNRGKVATAAAVLVASVAGTVAYTTELAEERDIAERERATAEAVTAFLVDLFKIADPNVAAGREISIRDVVDRGAAQLDEELADSPRIQARLKLTISTVYDSIGLYDESLQHAQDALAASRSTAEADPLLLAESLERTASAYWRQERYEESAAAAERAIAIRERELGPDHPSLVRALDKLGTVSYYLDRLEESAAYYRRAIAITQGHESMTTARLIAMSNLTITLQDLGRIEETEALYRELIALREAHFGPDHPRTAHALANYGAFLSGHHDRLDEALPILTRSLEIDIRAKGEMHHDVAHTLGILAAIERDRGNHEASAEHALRSAQIMRETVGPAHSRYGEALLRVGEARRRLGQLDQALADAQAGYEVLLAANGPDHTWTARGHYNLGLIYGDRGEWSEAAGHHRRSLAIREATGARPIAIAATAYELGRALLAQKNYVDAEAALRTAIENREIQTPPDPARLAAAVRGYAEALEGQGRSEEAGAVLARLETVNTAP